MIKEMSAEKRKALAIVIILSVVVLFPIILFGSLWFFTSYDLPNLEEVSSEFEKYNRTNDTYVVVSSRSFCFGFSEIYLGTLLDKGTDTGDCFISDGKMFFSYYERDENKQSYYGIYECDFYGENVKRLYTIRVNETDDFRYYSYIDTFNNAFYIANGTYIEVIYPIDGRRTEIWYSGNAYDYVKRLQDKSKQQYTVVKTGEKEIVVSDTTTLQEFVIGEETLNNSEEGKSLLKFKRYQLGCTISDNRILVTARIENKQFFGDSAYITFEYDVQNDKLIFQNYCEAFTDSFETYSY